MKKLPDIYKSAVYTNPNQSTFYSNSFFQDDSMETRQDISSVSTNLDKSAIIQEIFRHKNYSYTSLVHLRLRDGRELETRFVQENQGRILTIDNEMIDIDEIIAIHIV